MVQAVTVRGYLRTNFANAEDQGFTALHDRLIPEASGPTVGDRPHILDYAGLGAFDKAGEVGSNCLAAFQGMAADCNAEGLTGVITPGRYRLEPSTPITLRNGAAFVGVQQGGNTAGFDSGRGGVTFLAPFSVHRMTPLFAIQRGVRLEGFTIHYPDVVARLAAGAYTLDASGYPDIEGAPEAYAPAIVSQHRYDDAGALDPDGRNVGGVVLRDLIILGGYDGIYLGDADPEVEPWAAPFSSGKARTIPGVLIDGYGGYVLRRNLVLERSNNSVQCRNFLFSPANWIEAGQMWNIPEGKPGWISDESHPGHRNPQPLIRWAQRNNVLITCQRKVLATFDNIAARSGWQVFKLDAAQVPASYNNPNTNGPDKGADGQDSGKFRLKIRNVAIERYPTLMRIEPTAYIHRTFVSGGGHFMDHDDPACVAPVIDVRTHKAKAGIVHRRHGLHQPIGDYVGWRNHFELDIVEASGPAFENTADDGHHHYFFVNTNVARWAQGSKHTLSAFHNNSPISRLYHQGGIMQRANSGSRRAYRVVDVTVGHGQMLHPSNISFYGLEPNTLVIKPTPAEAEPEALIADWNGFSDCYLFDETDTADDADDSDGERRGNGGLEAPDGSA